MTRLYPQVSAEEWIKRHPGLHLRSKRCGKCKTVHHNNIPFQSRDWAGLECKPCPCRGMGGFSSQTPLSKELIHSTRAMFYSLKQAEELNSQE